MSWACSAMFSCSCLVSSPSSRSAQHNPIRITIKLDGVLPATDYNQSNDQHVTVRMLRSRKQLMQFIQETKRLKDMVSAMHPAAVQHVLKGIHSDMES